MVRIRRCRLSDFESVFRLIGQLRPDVILDHDRTQRTFSEAFNGQSRRQLCAVNAGRILGFCSITARSRLCPRGLRPLFDELSDEHVALAGRASQLLHWHATHARCGRCGRPMIDMKAERARHCPRCGLTSFPRVSPAVIVAVVRDDAILLAQGRGFKEGLYSVLAGFVEPGESLEAAVHRELREEVGVTVKNVAYFGSQPWPFPDSLMVAFTAEYAGGEIRVDESEIVEAGWYEPASLPAVPGRFSIARRLIDWFVDAHARSKL